MKKIFCALLFGGAVLSGAASAAVVDPVEDAARQKLAATTFFEGWAAPGAAEINKALGAHAPDRLPDAAALEKAAGFTAKPPFVV